MALSLLKRHRRKFDSLSLIDHGENTTFRARSQRTDYLCRIHRPGYQTFESIRSEMEFIEHLRGAGIAVPKPIFLKGEAVQILNAPVMEPRFGVLFQWLHGQFQTKLTVESARKTGAFMARMHVASESFKPKRDFFRPRLDADGLMKVMGGSFDDLASVDRKLFLKIMGALDGAASDLGYESDCFGLVHCDFHYGNRIWNAGELIAIDFDDSGWCWYIYDVAVCLCYHQTQSNFSDLWASFMEGYRSVRKMSVAETEMLDLFATVRRVQLAMWMLGRSDHPEFVKSLPTVLELTRVAVRKFLKR